MEQCDKVSLHFVYHIIFLKKICWNVNHFHFQAEQLYLRSIKIGRQLFGLSYSGLEYDYRGLIQVRSIMVIIKSLFGPSYSRLPK